MARGLALLVAGTLGYFAGAFIPTTWNAYCTVYALDRLPFVFALVPGLLLGAVAFMLAVGIIYRGRRRRWRVMLFVCIFGAGLVCVTERYVFRLKHLVPGDIELGVACRQPVVRAPAGELRIVPEQLGVLSSGSGGLLLGIPFGWEVENQRQDQEGMVDSWELRVPLSLDDDTTADNVIKVQFVAERDEIISALFTGELPRVGDYVEDPGALVRAYANDFDFVLAVANVVPRELKYALGRRRRQLKAMLELKFLAFANSVKVLRAPELRAIVWGPVPTSGPPPSRFAASVFDEAGKSRGTFYFTCPAGVMTERAEEAIGRLLWHSRFEKEAADPS